MYCKDVHSYCEETGNGHVQLLAKIETNNIDNIDEIIEAADGTTIARGEHVVSKYHSEMVPVYQKRSSQKVNAAGKVVVTATNMLKQWQKTTCNSFEVFDVFNVFIDGTDATMLSGESANVNTQLNQFVITIDKNAQTLLKEYIVLIHQHLTVQLRLK